MSLPGTRVRVMTSVVITKVCVDILLLLHALLSGWLTGVPCWILLSWCGLLGLLGSITAGALLICTLIEGVDSSSVSGYVGVG